MRHTANMSTGLLGTDRGIHHANTQIQQLEHTSVHTAKLSVTLTHQKPQGRADMQMLLPAQQLYLQVEITNFRLPSSESTLKHNVVAVMGINVWVCFMVADKASVAAGCTNMPTDVSEQIKTSVLCQWVLFSKTSQYFHFHFLCCEPASKLII